VKKQTKCPECGVDISLAGLAGHRKFKHGIGLNFPNIPASAAMAQNTTKITEKPEVTTSVISEKEIVLNTNPAENQHDPATCPECQTHTSRIAVLGQEHAAEIEDLSYRLKLAQDTIANLQAEVETKEDTEEETVPVPEVADFIKHCEDGTCEHHAKSWNEVKERIVKAAIENIDPTMIPDKVIESEGLRRNFIPKRITIPMR
jgi:hypothetical protein